MSGVRRMLRLPNGASFDSPDWACTWTRGQRSIQVNGRDHFLYDCDGVYSLYPADECDLDFAPGEVVPMTGGALPARAFSPSTTAVMVAVLAGHRTYSDLVDHVGLSRSTIARHLHKLRAAGLVAWEDHQAGTLRPSLQIVPLERDARVVAGSGDLRAGQRNR